MNHNSLGCKQPYYITLALKVTSAQDVFRQYQASSAVLGDTGSGHITRHAHVTLMTGLSCLYTLYPIPTASLGFLSDYLAADRKALAIYPIVLFYLSISCLIATQKSGLF